MKHQVSRISPHQTAKVFAIAYLLAGILLAIFWWFARSVIGPFGPTPHPMQGFPGRGLILLMPIGYAVMGYLSTLVVCWIYNLVAGWVGGIEITLEEHPSG